MHTSLSQETEYSAIYIDDILIYSFSWEEHLVHITSVLHALREAGLTAKPSKCVWGWGGGGGGGGAHFLQYLGHKIGDGRVKALRDYHKLTNQKGFRVFWEPPVTT